MKEKNAITIPGALMLLVSLGSLVYAGFLMFGAVKSNTPTQAIAPVVIVLLNMFVVWPGFFIIEPGGSKVLILFGSYRGTVRTAGFHWANPFLTKRNISLRVRTLNGQMLKVNDLAGNPIEIAAVVVWQVEDTYRASFDVDNYEQYVAMQSETALRHSASIFPYDADDETISLRKNTIEVGDHLRDELTERLERAGVKVVEARLSHLAYASEIAGAMLRRQQATAVIAARSKIVEGAVTMVQMALDRLESDGVVHLDEERKATMVSNLMVVLCSEQSAQPIVNAGTLYN